MRIISKEVILLLLMCLNLQSQQLQPTNFQFRSNTHAGRNPNGIGLEDSLMGFNEHEVKLLMNNENVMGEEAENYLMALKRTYINGRYSLNSANPVMNQGGEIKLEKIGKVKGVVAASCNNIDFELTAPGSYSAANAITGWTLSSMSMSLNSCSTGTWLPGAAEFSVVATPINSFAGVGTINQSPFGGSVVAVLNSTLGNASKTKIATTISVSPSNNLLKYAYAGFFSDAGHGCCYGAGFSVRVLDCSNNVISCYTHTYDPICPKESFTFYSGSTPILLYGYSTNWRIKYVDLTPYEGSCVTLECWANDCAFGGGHIGHMVFDASCGTTSSTSSVNLLPSIGVSGNLTICPGQSSTVTASGANTFTWSNGPSTLSQVFTPSVTSVYSVSGTSSYVCPGTKVFTVIVSSCLGFENAEPANTDFNIYPNPGMGIFVFQCNKPIVVFLYDSNGELVLTQEISQGKNTIDLSELKDGVYIIKSKTITGAKFRKLIKISEGRE